MEGQTKMTVGIRFLHTFPHFRNRPRHGLSRRDLPMKGLPRQGQSTQVRPMKSRPAQDRRTHGQSLRIGSIKGRPAHGRPTQHRAAKDPSRQGQRMPMLERLRATRITIILTRTQFYRSISKVASFWTSAFNCSWLPVVANMRKYSRNRFVLMDEIGRMSDPRFTFPHMQ
jgi:hypothetical protein